MRARTRTRTRAIFPSLAFCCRFCVHRSSAAPVGRLSEGGGEPLLGSAAEGGGASSTQRSTLGGVRQCHERDKRPEEGASEVSRVAHEGETREGQGTPAPARCRRQTPEVHREGAASGSLAPLSPSRIKHTETEVAKVEIHEDGRSQEVEIEQGAVQTGWRD